jgi:hypothetical protein
LRRGERSGMYEAACRKWFLCISKN